ncbi:peptidase S8/S53 domain-containing protein [Flagelloscypha sp. PMI_526]|nr:peptidase S8/S53 domain-containing protein [Flagelloscypha sp. PMI_526]
MRPLSLPLYLLLSLVHGRCIASHPSQVVHNGTKVFGPREDAPWHLRSISSSAALKLGQKKYYWDEPELGCKPGDGVVVYLLDSGVNTLHEQFSEVDIDSFVVGDLDNTAEDSSKDGHGTGMASLIVGKDLGLARGAKLISGKVYDQKTGTMDLMTNLCAAMDFIFQDFQTRDPKTRFGVISVSVPLSNGDGTQGRLWVEKMAMAQKLGLVLVLASGNSAENLCYGDQELPRPQKSNPPKTYEIVVGATNEFNEVASYSNLGSCIDLWAPGSRVTCGVGDNVTPLVAYMDTGGTSNSAALVTGMIAYTSTFFDSLYSSSVSSQFFVFCLLSESCHKGLTQSPDRDIFVQHLTRNRLSVRESLVSVRQNAKPWLAKLSFPLESTMAAYPFEQVPLQRSFQLRPVKWNILAVTSLSPFYVSAQLQDKWQYNTDLFDLNTDGKDVMVYLLDTGMKAMDTDFVGTHVQSGDTIPGIEGEIDPWIDSSDTWHGTRMASLIAGAYGGVALKTSLFPIKICGSTRDCAGMEARSDFMSRIYQGFRKAINHFKVYPGKKGVISINFPVFFEEGSTIWKNLVEEAGKLGLLVVIPVGDNGENRCWIDTAIPIPGKTQPEKTIEFVVGASTEWGEDATFSNRGRCTTVWAPGSHIKAIDPDRKFSSRDGTDQASAIVTGLLAGILSNPKYKGPVDRFVISNELTSKNIKVDACETCLRGAQPWLAKHAGNLPYA